MQLFHNNFDASVPTYLDYDLIALINTLAYSFEEGLHLASSMLNAPFFIANTYDYICIRSQSTPVNDTIWDHISETGFCTSTIIESNKNIYTSIIPQVGKMIYYSPTEPTPRQRQLASYSAWIISQFGKENFHMPDFNNTTSSTLFFYLLNNQFDMIYHQSVNFSLDKLPHQLQILACHCNAANDSHIPELSKLCNHTKYITAHMNKYRLYLFAPLSVEQMNLLSDYLKKQDMYAGLSYPFQSYRKCNLYANQSIAALEESTSREFNNHLAQYEELFAFDVFRNFSSDVPLTQFRHPLFSYLKNYDKKNNSELYHTLMTYIEESGNSTETANALCVHRNTVLYRLRQITEITSYDIQDASHRASLQYAYILELALKKHD